MLREVNSGATPIKSFIVSTVPVLVYRVEGFFNTAGTTDFYVQVHDAAAVPSNGALPLKSYEAQANFVFSQHIGEGLPCKTGCVIVLSSTKDTLTIATVGTDTMSVYCDIEEYETLAVKPTYATAGDTTTPVAGTQQIWSDATGPKKLVRLQITEKAGSIVYVMLFVKDTPGATAPIREWKLLANASLDLGFGLNGVPVYSKDADGTFHDGCTIGFSSIPATYDAGGLCSCKGTYIN